MSPPAYVPKTLGEASDALARQETQSETLVAELARQTDTHASRLKTFLYRASTPSLIAQAKAADARYRKGAPLSSLDGIPIAIKDNICTVGEPTTAASRILEGFESPYDATVIARLKRAGAILVGKTNLDEFAMGSSNENSAYGAAKNPWNESRAPGGSSGGSAAAVAAGFAYGALGTDTGGSVRQPASFCGVAGFKPTYGRISRFGAIAFASSLDQVGTFARDVRGTAELYNVIAGHDPRDATSLTTPVQQVGAGAFAPDAAHGLRVGVPRGILEADGLSEVVQARMTTLVAQLQDAGATVVDVELERTDVAVATYYVLATAEAASNLSRYDGVRYGPRRGQGEDLAALYKKTRGELFGPEVKRRILLGTYVLSSGYYDAYYRRAQRVRRLIQQAYLAALADVDVLLMPTAPTPAFALGDKVDDPLTMYLSDIFTIGVNLAGTCAISVNVGRACSGPDAGLPIGAQLVGKPLDEVTLFRAASALEQVCALDDADTIPQLTTT